MPTANWTRRPAGSGWQSCLSIVMKPPTRDLLVAAAKDAMYLSNLPLSERIARAAFERGGGVREAGAAVTCAVVAGTSGAGRRVLTRFEPQDLDELQLVQVGHSPPFDPLLDDGRCRTCPPDSWHCCVNVYNTRASSLWWKPTGSAIAVHENRIAEGLAAAERVLADPHAPKQAIDFAAYAAGLGMPVAGRGADFEPIAARCRAEQRGHTTA